MSVDAPFQDGEEGTLLDVMENKDVPDTDQTLERESLSREIERTLSILSEKERAVIRYYYGVGGKEMSLEEIGNELNLTRERVRQIKEKAIRRLRHSSRNRLLRKYLG